VSWWKSGRAQFNESEALAVSDKIGTASGSLIGDTSVD
jgi:hypothetical protein